MSQTAGGEVSERYAKEPEQKNSPMTKALAIIAAGCTPESKRASTMTPTLSSTPLPTEPGKECDYQLELVSVITKFCTERHFPPFIARVVERSTGRVYPFTSGWQLRFRLVDGHGMYMDFALTNDQAKMPLMPHGGETRVCGLRFQKVSSKHGGFFNLECELMAPSPFVSRVGKARTHAIKIISYRVWGSQDETSLVNLSGSSPVKKLPGIGRQYSDRLHECGYCTIQDLASLSDTEGGRVVVRELLHRIRHARGSLTEGKFLDHIKLAKEIVTRTSGKKSGPNSPCLCKTGGNNNSHDNDFVMKEEEGAVVEEARGLKRRHSDMINGNLASEIDAAALAMMRSQSLPSIPTTTPPHSPEKLSRQIPQMTTPMLMPTLHPTMQPTLHPTMQPTLHPTMQPTTAPPTITLSSGSLLSCRNTIPNNNNSSSSSNYDTKPITPNTSFPLPSPTNIANTPTHTIAHHPTNTNLNTDCNLQEFTPLMLACALGQETILRLLTDIKPLDLKKPRLDKWTALHMATLNVSKHPILEKEPTTTMTKTHTSSTPSPLHWTPLMVAVLQAHLHTIASSNQVSAGSTGLAHVSRLNSVLDALAFTKQQQQHQKS